LSTNKLSSRFQGPRSQTSQPISVLQTCIGSETVLLIQDAVPWCGDAVVEELTAQGKNFCMINSSEIGTTDLLQFNEIVIPSDQPQTYYDNLFPSGVVHPAITEFVEQCGILSANLTDFGSNDGNWVDRTFVGGLQHVISFSENNDIADPTHPIITGTLPCPSGNCGPIVDVGPQNDLDDWGSSSHGYFTNLPPGTEVILVDSEQAPPQPVMIEYLFGNGVVIASLTTTEWRYSGCPGDENKELLANEIAYQDFLVENPPSGKECLR
jgi:hypothetical protein